MSKPRCRWILPANRLLLPLRGVGADRLIDHITIPVGNADDDCEVFLFYLPRLELGRQRIVGLIVFGHYDHATCIAIEPVDNSRPGGPAPSTHCAEMMGQRAGERPALEAVVLGEAGRREVVHEPGRVEAGLLGGADARLDGGERHAHLGQEHAHQRTGAGHCGTLT